MINEFEHWYQYESGLSDDYFDKIIDLGCINEALDIKCYMKMAFEAGQLSVNGELQ